MIITVFLSVTDHMMLYLVFINIFFHYPFWFSYTFSKYSSGHGPFLGRETRDFIPEGIARPRSCCCFLLTLIIGHGKIKRHIKRSPAFQTFVSLPLLWNNSKISFWWSAIINLASTITFYACLFRGMRCPNQPVVVLTSNSTD